MNSGETYRKMWNGFVWHRTRTQIMNGRSL